MENESQFEKKKNNAIKTDLIKFEYFKKVIGNGRNYSKTTMKKIFSILFIIFISCSRNSNEIKFNTKDQNITTEVNLINKKCKDFFLQNFSEKEFEKYFKLNSKETIVFCGENKFSLNDSINCQPNFYRIAYDFNIDNNFQETIEIEFDSLIKQENVDSDLLIGLRRIADNTIKINRQKALEIARQNEISEKNRTIYFKIYKYPKSSPKFKSKNPILYYWEIKNDCNNCNSISIDAETGNVFSEGKTVHVY